MAPVIIPNLGSWSRPIYIPCNEGPPIINTKVL